MLLDYYPDIEVIIKDGEELRVAGTKELLPFAYVSVWSKERGGSINK
jgi:cytidine deaminase